MEHILAPCALSQTLHVPREGVSQGPNALSLEPPTLEAEARGQGVALAVGAVGLASRAGLRSLQRSWRSPWFRHQEEQPPGDIAPSPVSTGSSR